MLSSEDPGNCLGSDCMLSEAEMHVFRFVVVVIPRPNAHVAWDIMTWEHFPYCWPFVMGIGPLPIDSSDQGPVMYSVHILFFANPNKLFKKQWVCRGGLQMISGVMMLMWRHCNGFWFLRMNSFQSLWVDAKGVILSQCVDAEIGNTHRKFYLCVAYFSPLRMQYRTELKSAHLYRIPIMNDLVFFSLTKLSTRMHTNIRRHDIIT